MHHTAPGATGITHESGSNARIIAIVTGRGIHWVAARRKIAAGRRFRMSREGLRPAAQGRIRTYGGRGGNASGRNHQAAVTGNGPLSGRR
jgi:hypothetical protein